MWYPQRQLINGRFPGVSFRELIDLNHSVTACLNHKLPLRLGFGADFRFDAGCVTGGTLLSDEKAQSVFRGVSIDSRVVKPGELFIAIRGEINDGHDYIRQAVDSGAAGVIVDASYALEEGNVGDAAVVTVIDSHKAMIELARQYRNSIGGRFIGITGSNGKTTTKELTHRLLQPVEPRSYCSPGNLNNLFGVPL